MCVRESKSIPVAFKLYFVLICIYVQRNMVTASDDGVCGPRAGVYVYVYVRLCFVVFLLSLLARGYDVGRIKFIP